MNTTMTAPRVRREIPAWEPPLDAGGLRLVLARVISWKPLDIEAIFDDLDGAIGEQRPDSAATTALLERLRSHLKQLSHIAVADPKYPPTEAMVQLIKRGHSIRAESASEEDREALGLARRLAFVTADLLEELIEARYIRGAE